MVIVWRYSLMKSLLGIVASSVASDPWNTILNSSYASNIVAAYDFRDFNGSEVVAKIGPNLETNNVTDVNDGLSFVKTNGSWAFADATVSCTYPFTMVYIANTNTDPDIEDVLINCSESRFGFDIIVFTRGYIEQGLMPYNGEDNQDTGYFPNGSEWYYFAVSFLNNGTVRYATRKLSGNLNGTVAGSDGEGNFNGYPGVAAGFGSESVYNTTGIYRSAFFINQGFSTEEQMEDLFNILSASADGLTIQ